MEKKSKELFFLDIMSTSSLDSIQSQLHSTDSFMIFREAGTLRVDHSKAGTVLRALRFPTGNWHVSCVKGLITREEYPLTSIDSLLY